MTQAPARKPARRSLAVLVVSVLLASWHGGVASAYYSRGTASWGLYGSDATWLTWNATGGWVYIPEATLNLGPRSVLLEALKGAATGPGYCVDAVFDWAVSTTSNNTHHDARVRRNCNQGLRTWTKAELVPPSIDPYVLVGELKHGACYLMNATSNGRFGSNLYNDNKRYPGYCVGYAGLGDFSTELAEIQAGFPASPVNPRCVSARIAYGTVNLSLNSLNDRSCVA